MSQTSTEQPTTETVREWAIAQGYEVAATGRLSNEVKQAYEDAHK